MKLNNLVLVAGTGRNSGKTTMVCRIITQFRHISIISIKISPHFHEPSEGLILLSKNKKYSIYEETDNGTSKDSSRMLRCGAERVYYIQSTEESMLNAFLEIYRKIASDKPVICESPALIRYVEPGVLINMISRNVQNSKSKVNAEISPHLLYYLEDLDKTSILPIDFRNGSWYYLKEDKN